MHTEVEYAVNFLVDSIKEKHSLSDELYEKLRERLTKLLLERYENHWYTEKPMKGSAYRCININVEESSVDQVLRQAAEESDITMKRLLEIFDKGLALWVDPNDVSCRLGKGSIFFIYKKLNENSPSDAKQIPSTNSTSIPQRRPQQRPRSISPTASVICSENYVQSSRPRSTTPPGFSRFDAGSLYQSYPRSGLSAENLQKLWNTIPNTTSYSTTSLSSVTQTPYATTSTSFNNYNNYTYNNAYTKNMDSSYSFNQYSSYYSPASNNWKKNKYQNGKQQYQNRANWQDDEVYQRYHWSRNDLRDSMSVAGNDIAMKSYGYSSRQAQEVC